MRRALALAFAVVVLTATPALAHERAIDLPAPVVDVVAGGDEHDGSGGAASEGEDGTDPAEFAALLLAGVATVGAVAALIFATKRAPA